MFFSDVVLDGVPEQRWNAIVTGLRKAVSIVLSNTGRWKSRCELEATDNTPVNTNPDTSSTSGYNEGNGGDLEAILDSANELISPELLAMDNEIVWNALKYFYVNYFYFSNDLMNPAVICSHVQI